MGKGMVEVERLADGVVAALVMVFVGARVECQEAWSRVPSVQYQVTLVWLTELVDREGAGGGRSSDAQTRRAAGGLGSGEGAEGELKTRICSL
jgi:hypothetical protein